VTISLEKWKPIFPVLTCFWLIVSCSTDDDPNPSLKLVQERDILPDNELAHRPDVVAIDNLLYLAYAAESQSGLGFKLLRLDSDANPSGDSFELYSASGLPTDIRVSQGEDGFWSAFETLDMPPPDACGKHILNAADYTITADGIELAAYETGLASGCPTTPDFMQHPPPANELPTNPKAVDDPTPLYLAGDYYILLRAWSLSNEQYYSSVQHVLRYDQDFNLLSQCLLDLGSVFAWQRFVLSQNSLLRIEEQVFLIAGIQDGPPLPEYNSDIYALALTADLCAPAGQLIPLVQNERYTTRVTASHYADGRLYLNYLVKDTNMNSQNDQGYLAVFEVDHTVVPYKFSLLSEIIFQEQGVQDSHSSFALLDDKVYVFYQGETERILLKVFEWSI